MDECSSERSAAKGISHLQNSAAKGMIRLRERYSAKERKLGLALAAAYAKGRTRRQERYEAKITRLRERYAAKKRKLEFKAARGMETEAAVKVAYERARKPRVRISVEGYDASLPEKEIKKALIDHFSSCGEIVNVTLSESRVGRAFIILRGDGAEEKALRLDGSDVGGWNALVQVTPEVDEETERYRDALTEETIYDERLFGICVSGYDATLPADELKSILIKHFSSCCGEITHVFINTRRAEAYVYFVQQDGEDKALELDGCHEVGGWKLALSFVAKTTFYSPLDRRSIPRFSCRTPTHCMMMAREVQEKIMAFKRMRGLV